MAIEYKINESLSVEVFIDLLSRSTLGERRPIDDVECMEGVLNNSNLIVSAWDGDTLIGVARSITDFYYACYLSDLAVDKDYQKQGVGKQLQVLTQKQLGPRGKLILLAAPLANDYYRHIGFTQHDRCWVLERDQSIR